MLLQALGVQRRTLLDWENNSPQANALYIGFCICLVLFAGCMSGLTLGLLSMDIVDLEVLIRSGNPQEQRRAKKIVPIVKNAHYLLVTLLLCNAAAMETLPLFLDKMVHELVAIIISVTAVLLFGEIIPQAVCSKHGLVVGSIMAWPVRILMIITAPVSWPLSKVLDKVLGGDHASLFRRKQLKALVTIHAKDEGFGGKLTPEEIQIITGAMDLTTKTAYTAMTPLEKVFMLSNRQKLDDATVEAIMSAKPFSRVPVFRGDNRKDIIGLILVKELLEYVKRFPDSPVSNLKIRPLPRLSASTPMYDMLKIFRTGRSHMALLTQPILISEHSLASSTLSSLLPLQTGDHHHLLGRGHPKSHEHAAFVAPLGSHALEQAVALGLDETQVAPMTANGTTANNSTRISAAQDGGSYHICHQHRHQGAYDRQAYAAVSAAGHVVSRTASSPARLPSAADCPAGVNGDLKPGSPRGNEHSLSAVNSVDETALAIEVSAAELGSAELHTTPHTAGSVTSKMSISRSAITSIKRFFRHGHGVEFSDGSHHLEGHRSGRRRKSGSSSSSTSRSHSDDLDDLLPVPHIAAPGEPIGIITIEDVIEELMQFEIVDELDKFVDNEQSLLVADAKLEHDLPENLRTVLTEAQQSTTQLPPLLPAQTQQPASMLSNIITSVLRPSQGGVPPTGASGQGLFRLSKQGSRARDTVELSPLLEEPSLHGIKVLPAEATANSALAAALLVAAGKRAPGAVTVRAQGNPGAKSHELFSYLGPFSGPVQQQQVVTTPAPAPAATATKPST